MLSTAPLPNGGLVHVPLVKVNWTSSCWAHDASAKASTVTLGALFVVAAADAVAARLTKV